MREPGGLLSQIADEKGNRRNFEVVEPTLSNFKIKFFDLKYVWINAVDLILKLTLLFSLEN